MLFKFLNAPTSEGKNYFGLDDPEVQSKYQDYMDYIDDHRRNVSKMWQCYQKELVDFIYLTCPSITKSDITWLMNRIIKDHDLSKYDKEEFIGYRVKFYPTKMEREAINNSSKYNNMVETEFNKAWIHHAHFNKHHPEYWGIMDYNNKWENILVPMDVEYLVEMLLDWAAMGERFNNSAYDYWKKHSHKKPLHSTSITFIDSIIDIFK